MLGCCLQAVLVQLGLCDFLMAYDTKHAFLVDLKSQKEHELQPHQTTLLNNAVAEAQVKTVEMQRAGPAKLHYSRLFGLTLFLS